MVTIAFAFSFLGTHTTFTCTIFSDNSFNSKWYEFPKDLQKFILPMVQFSHKNIEFHGYRLVICSVERFMKVHCCMFNYCRKHISIVLIWF